VARDLEGECSSLENRIEGTRSDQTRLEEEVTELRQRFEQTRDSHDEGRWRDHDHELELTRALQRDLRDRLDRVRAQRKHAYEMARNAAEQFKDYYEGLMKSYCSGNRKADRRQTLPAISLPPSLAKANLDDGAGPPPGPKPSSIATDSPS
jgi:chromosome segregation ATPase